MVSPGQLQVDFIDNFIGEINRAVAAFIAFRNDVGFLRFLICFRRHPDGDFGRMIDAGHESERKEHSAFINHIHTKHLNGKVKQIAL